MAVVTWSRKRWLEDHSIHSHA